MSGDNILIKESEVRAFFRELLKRAAVRDDVAEYLTEGVVQASMRGIDSHGIRLLPHYLAGLEAGRLNKQPEFRFDRTAPGAGKLDGDHAPGHAAGAVGMQAAIKLARETGIGAVGVFNSSHFGAAAYYAFMATREEMIGLSFTHATAHVLPYGGARPFLGNNPVCLAAPCEGEGPFCLDMATTVTTFNKVQQYKERGEKIPLGWGVDKQGKATDDPDLLESLLPIGGYKGFGLSMMVEILCALLTGAPYGPEVTKMFGTPPESKRRLGHFFMAIRIDAFQEPGAFKRRLGEMVERLRKEPALDPSKPVMAAGDPEKTILRERSQNGIPVPPALWRQFTQLSKDYRVKFRA